MSRVDKQAPVAPGHRLPVHLRILYVVDPRLQRAALAAAGIQVDVDKGAVVEAPAAGLVALQSVVGPLQPLRRGLPERPPRCSGITQRHGPARAVKGVPG